MDLVSCLIWLLAGVGIFIVGMGFLSEALEKSAGGGMKRMLEKISNNRFSGVGIGAGVTAIIQSSSATSVMVIGLVNAGVMTLMQATPIIMGANIGTTITGILVALKNDYFNMVMYFLAFAGVMMGFFKKRKIKLAGSLCSGLGLIFVGLEIMSSEQAFGSKEIKEMFAGVFSTIDFPLLLIFVGVIFTALIQSSSAATGVVITMVGTGVLPLELALFIILGANIGTCVTALLASVGANANSKRVAFIHFAFNAIGSVMFAVLIWIFSDTVVNILISMFPGEDAMALQMRVSAFHVIFNVTTTLILLPFVKHLVKLSEKLIRDKKDSVSVAKKLDERLFATPSIAVAQATKVTYEMSEVSVIALKKSLLLFDSYDIKIADEVRALEDKADKYEDALGSYLVKLSSRDLSDSDSVQVTRLLHIIGDLERISDHAVNIVESTEEMKDKKISFSAQATAEIRVMRAALDDILDVTNKTFIENDAELATEVDPIEEVIDDLRDQIKLNHIMRLQKSECTIEHGFILNDLLGNFERVSDHCANIAECVAETSKLGDFDMHKYSAENEESVSFKQKYVYYQQKYKLN